MFVYVPVKVNDSAAIFVYTWGYGVATPGVDSLYPHYNYYCGTEGSKGSTVELKGLKGPLWNWRVWRAQFGTEASKGPIM